MSLTSRGLLTKIYGTDSTSSPKKKKQKPSYLFNSLHNSRNKEQNNNELKNKISEKDFQNFNNQNNNQNYYNNKESTKTILEDNKSNNFPKIPKVNAKTISSINESKNNEINENIIKLDYNIIESTSEDQNHPLRELKRGLKGMGWQSERFCQYPQYIYVQFSQPALIKRIDIVFHEKNIPSLIKFYSYMPQNKDGYISNYLKANYEYIGFIKPFSNERSYFQSRESRKITINSKCLFLKLELEKNHYNNYNLFNQIGLMKLEFLGEYLQYIGGNNKNNQLILKNAIKRKFFNDRDLDSICGAQLTELKKQMNYNIEIENYKECKEIKKKIDMLRLYGKRIFDLESEKTLAINNEDFSKAIELRNLVDKMKINIKNIDSINISNKIMTINDNKDNQSIKANKFSNIPIDLNSNSGNQNANVGEFNEINESIISSINDNNNNYNKILKNNMTLSNISSYNNIIKSQDAFISYDEKILPTVLKRLNHEEGLNEEELYKLEKGELEEISPEILKEYSLFKNVIGEENMRKLFSKQILWKEEGLIIFIEKIDEILNKSNNKNDIITLIMKLSLTLFEENHPLVIIKTIEILKKLFEYIKKKNIKLNVDMDISNEVLLKIKQKLGDVNPKVRDKSVSLYCFMLTLSFCDYNNLISELVEEEIKSNNKYIPKSSNLTLGKLDIFINILTNFEEAIKMKITNKNIFPSVLVMDYLIYNISHKNPDIRKKTRNAIFLFFKIFEIEKFKKKLEQISQNDLGKLIEEIPELKKYFPDIPVNQSIKINESIKSSIIRKALNSKKENKQKNKKKSSVLFFNKGKKISKGIFLKNPNIESNDNNNNNEEKEKNDNNNSEKNNDNNNSNKNNNKSINKNKQKKDFCNYCKKNLKEGDILANHYISSCPMFTKCEKCSMNLEVKKLNNHRGKECKFKDEYKLCNTCKEYIIKNEYDLHIKNKCKLKKGFVKCPLCHQDIKDSQNDFYQHLVIQGCPSQKRNK